MEAPIASPAAGTEELEFSTVSPSSGFHSLHNWPQISTGLQKFKLELFLLFGAFQCLQYRHCAALRSFCRHNSVPLAPRTLPSHPRNALGPPCALSRPRILNLFCNFHEFSEISPPIRKPIPQARGGNIRPQGGLRAALGRQKPEKCQKSSKVCKI